MAVRKKALMITVAGAAALAVATGGIVLATGDNTSEGTPVASAGGGGADVGLSDDGAGDGMTIEALVGGTTKSFPAKVDINGRKRIGQPADAPGHKENAYKVGQMVPVKCQAGYNGAIWDLTTDGWWVPDTYVKTGTDDFAPGVARCSTSGGGGGGGSTVHGRSNGPAGQKGGTRAEKIDRVIKAATSQSGKGYNYSWGAGGKGGASYGVHHYPDGDAANGDDYNRLGYDCSGLTQYAFWKGAGIDIGEWTGTQYAAGKRVSVNDLQPGDLIFWGSGDQAGSTTHVALYLGNRKMIEAAPPRDGKSVHVTDLYGQQNWTAHAIRVID